MFYLVDQLFWLLLIAFIVGLIVGWKSYDTAGSKR